MDESTTTQEGTIRYTIGECIGEGGVGSVYRARDERLSRWVAVKRLLIVPGVSMTETAERIRREAHVLAALQHPNIVTVHDFGADETGPFVVMEFIEGETLERVVERAPLDNESFVNLATQTLAGMAAAHQTGLLHRDLKPGNLMLTWPPGGGFQVKILDFGLAKFAPQPTVQTIDHGDSLLGSIHYMAPEQFRRQPLDARTDLYSLGCIFYFALAGRHPFDGESVAEIMAAHLEHRLYDLAPQRPDLPAALCEWVMSLMNPDPLDRPRDAVEAQAGMRAATRRNTATVFQPMVPATSAVTIPAADTPRKFSVPVLAVIILAVLASSAAGFYFVRKQAATAPAVAAATPVVSVPAKPATATPATAAIPPAAVAVVSPTNVAPVPAPTTQASAAPAPVTQEVGDTSPAADTFEATDMASLRTHLGQTVTIRGTVAGTGQSKSGTVLYLNFSRRPHEALAVIFFVGGRPGDSAAPSARPAQAQSDLQPYVGKTVQIRSKLSDYKGDLQIVLQSLDQIQVEP